MPKRKSTSSANSRDRSNLTALTAARSIMEGAKATCSAAGRFMGALTNGVFPETPLARMPTISFRSVTIDMPVLTSGTPAESMAWTCRSSFSGRSSRPRRAS